MNINHDAIDAIIRESAEQEILPLWQNLQQHQIEFKNPGDVVTVADRACEKRLSKALLDLMPGSLVVGEESVHQDASLIAALDAECPVWVIDPLDGTSNFAAGEGPIAIMVCLVNHRETLGAWIYDPVANTMLQAELGAGASLNGKPMNQRAFKRGTAEISGALSTKYLPASLKPKAEAGACELGSTRASGCAGYDYRALATGDYQFVFYYRTLVWDHAPGVLISRETGARVGRYDGSAYQPTETGTGLICATDEHTWTTVRDLLVAP